MVVLAAGGRTEDDSERPGRNPAAARKNGGGAFVQHFNHGAAPLTKPDFDS